MPRLLIAFLSASVFCASQTFAQEPQMSPQEAVASSLGAQWGKCLYAVAGMQAENNKLTARIKALEDKYEPKTPDNK